MMVQPNDHLIRSHLNRNQGLLSKTMENDHTHYQCSLLCSSYITLCGLFCKGMNPIYEHSTTTMYLPPKGLITRKVRISIYEFGEGTHTNQYHVSCYLHIPSLWSPIHSIWVHTEKIARRGRDYRCQQAGGGKSHRDELFN